MRYLVPRNRRNDNVGFLDDFDRFFENFWNLAPEAAPERNKTPLVDVRETDSEYVLEAEIPGYSEDNVDVNVDNHVLHISSKKEEDRTEGGEDKGYVLKERKSYSFDRSFVLPENVDEDKIKGTFKNGILTLTMPKKEEKKPKKVNVKLES
ncbi:MAG: Hsp20/alpha crystallin family protein [Spirochaetota bacterium]